jgi:hypothetical protein
MTNSFYLELQKKQEQYLVDQFKTLVHQNFELQSKFVIQDFETNAQFLYENMVNAIPESGESVDKLYDFWLDSCIHEVTLQDFVDIARDETKTVNDETKIVTKTYQYYKFAVPEFTFENERPLESAMSWKSKFGLVTKEVALTPYDLSSELETKRKYSIVSSNDFYVKFELGTGMHQPLFDDIDLVRTTLEVGSPVSDAIFIMVIRTLSKTMFFSYLKPSEPVATELNFSLENIPVFEALSDAELRGPTHNQQTCYINTVLVSLLLFPTQTILNILYQTPVLYKHALDVHAKLCSNSEKVNIIEPMSIEEVRKLAQISYNDKYERMMFVWWLRRYYNALHTPTSDIEVAREGIVKSVERCKNLGTGTAKVGGIGEPQTMFEVLSELFPLPNTNFKHVTSTMSDSDETEQHCVSKQKFSTGLLVPTQDDDQDNPKLLSEFLLRESIEEEKDTFDCTFIDGTTARFKKRGVVNFFDGNLFAFEYVRQIWNPRAAVRLKTREITPDEVLQQGTSNLLYLRAVILYLFTYQGSKLVNFQHYIAVLRKPGTTNWFLYDSEKLTLFATSYNELLEKDWTHTDIMRNDTVFTKLVKKNSVLFIYSNEPTLPSDTL